MYTKGEWKAHKGMKVTGQAGLIYVADCYPFNERMARPTLHEAKANARLIAQAPKLYEACKQASDVFERLADWGDIYQDDKRLALLRKAIASVEEK